MPYAAAQIVFSYNSKFVNGSAIASMADLLAWAVAHPGRFTYAAPWSQDNVTLVPTQTN
jgi:predicted outer membrane repeat protein